MSQEFAEKCLSAALQAINQFAYSSRDPLLMGIVDALHCAKEYGLKHKGENDQPAFFEVLKQFYEWLYLPKVVDRSLAWTCNKIVEDGRDPAELYRRIVEPIEDLMAWRELPNEERIAERWEKWREYDLPVSFIFNDWLEL